MTPYLDAAMQRYPGARRRRPAHLLLRSRVVHARPAPDARSGTGGRRRLRRSRAQQPRHPARRRRRKRCGAMDRRRSRTGRRHRTTPSSARCRYETTRKFRGERVPESLGVLFGDGAWPTFQWTTGRGIRRSALHDRLAALGARFGQSRAGSTRCGSPVRTRRRPPVSRPPGAALPPSRPCAGARRRPRGRRRHGHVAHVEVQRRGPGRVDAARTGSPPATSTSPTERSSTPSGATSTAGILADLTVTRLAADRFLVIASDVSHRRVQKLLRTALEPGEVAVTTDITSGTTLLSVQGPRSRELLAVAVARRLVRRGLPLPHRARAGDRLLPRPRPARHLPR